MNRSKNWMTILAVLFAALFLFSACTPKEAEVAEVAEASALETLPLEVDVQQAAEYRDAGFFVLDVREPDEWEAGHIPGATLIPLGELGTRFTELPTDQSILVYCRSGNRSAVARDFLLEMFPSTTSMAGGFNEWVAAGYDVETGQ
jgi:rhodanese-related sulfurtransferase